MTIFQTIRDWVGKLTLFAAGTDDEVLSLCSSAEKGKYSMLGSLVYIPVATSTVGILFAASYFTRNPLTVAGVVLGWGIVVFLIERAIVAHLRPGEVSLAVFARVILALALSTIVAELLTVFVFRRDIDDRIRQEQAAEIALVSGAGQERITALKGELDARKAAVDAKEQAYLDEIDGRNGTGLHGYGPSARAKKEAYQKEMQEYEAAKVRLEAEIAEARMSRNESVAATAKAQQTGLLQAFSALYEMAAESTTILVVLILLHVYFLLVELLPLAVKLHMQGGHYYLIMDEIGKMRLELSKVKIEAEKFYYSLLCKHELTYKRLELENKAVQMAIDKAGEKALMQSRGLVSNYAQMADLEDEASGRLPASYLSAFKRQHDLVFNSLIDSLNTIITAA